MSTDVHAAWEAIRPHLGGGRLVLVAVDGRSGAGKTVFSRQLRELAADRLGTGAHAIGIVPVEELYAGWGGLEAAPALLDWCVLRPLRQGATRVTWPRWDWHAGRYADEGSLDRPSTGLVLVEGVGCSAPPARGAYEHVIWLDAPAWQRREAVARREQAAPLGKGSDTWWVPWAEAEERLLRDRPPVWDQLVERKAA
ncbi:nucleoside/nucleotide kinase family protein [Kytococcus sp. Marseille-QA3725]